MKFTILFVFLLSFSLSKAQKDSTLFGEWELIKIEKRSDTLFPDAIGYSLFIDSNMFRYNLEINLCYIYDWKTIANEIIFEEYIMCTCVCCDGRNSDFYNNLNYVGKYSFREQNNILIIENIDGKFYLKRKI